MIFFFVVINYTAQWSTCCQLKCFLFCLYVIFLYCPLLCQLKCFLCFFFIFSISIEDEIFVVVYSLLWHLLVNMLKFSYPCCIVCFNVWFTVYYVCFRVGVTSYHVIVMWDFLVVMSLILFDLLLVIFIIVFMMVVVLSEISVSVGFCSLLCQL